MALVSKVEWIDGHKFEVTQLTARRAVKLTYRLSKMAGPTFATVLQQALQGTGLAEAKGQPTRAALMAAVEKLDVDKLGPAFEGLFDRMTEQDVDYLQQELLSTALMDDALLWEQFDVALQGQLGTVFKLLWFALRVQFQNFSRGPAASRPAGTQAPASP